MYGAILGDIIGSPYEFDRGDKVKNFPLFSKGSEFTDDTVMTIAVGEALLSVGPNAAQEEMKSAVIERMQAWGQKYPYAGYGGMFRHWLRERKPKPYGSYGNGSAMRVSAAGWLYDSLERTREVARVTAEVTHNHPEGIKGAEATAACIYMARKGAAKEQIRAYVEQKFSYNLHRTLDEIRPKYHHVETCQETVPEAITAFIEAVDFEDAIRNAVSLGGDTDTLAAITGSIAEAFYGIPDKLLEECRERVDKDILAVLNEFDRIRENLMNTEEQEDYLGAGIKRIYEDRSEAAMKDFLSLVCMGMKKGLTCAVPFTHVGQSILEGIDVTTLKAGDSISLDSDVRLKLDTVKDVNDDSEWFYVLTSDSIYRKNPCGEGVFLLPLVDMIERAASAEHMSGLIFNPFDLYVKMDKQMLEVVRTVYKNMEEE